MNSTNSRRFSLFFALVAAAVVALVWTFVRLDRGSPARPIPAPRDTSGTSSSSDPKKHDPLALDPGTRVTPPVHDVPATTPDLSGWRVAGHVHARGGAPVAGAEVALELLDASGATIARHASASAADGTYALALAELADMDPLQRRAASITLRFAAAAHAPKQVTRALAGLDVDHELLALDVRLETGTRLAGRAVDAHAHPVSGAHAVLRVRSVTRGAEDWIVCAESNSDASGRFELGFASAASYHLSVRADGTGTAFRALDLAADQDRDLGDVALAGGAPIAGVARHKDGSPAAGLELWAIEGDLASQDIGLALATRRASEAELGDGLLTAIGRTDADGRFSLAGLRPGQYALRAPEPRVIVEPRAARYEPGATGVQLDVESSEIVVHVVNSAGKPLIGAQVSCTRLSTAGDGALVAGELRSAVTRGSTAVASFPVDTETPFALRARAGAAHSPEKMVVLAPNQGRLEETLTLAGANETARVRIVVGGDAPPGPLALRAELVSSVTGIADDDIGLLEADESGLLPEVPAGDYQLEVEFRGEAGRWLFPARTREVVHVASGTEAHAYVEARRGGRVAIKVDVSGRAPDGLDAVRGRGVTIADFEAMRRARFGARFTLVPDGGGATRTVVFARTQGGVVGSQLMPGEQGDVEGLLAPGDWILRAEGRTWKPAEMRVHVEVGRTVEIALALEAR